MGLNRDITSSVGMGVDVSVSKQVTGSASGGEAFISVWSTTGVDETITIPTQNIGTFNADVDWGDGTVETITAYDGFSHEYADIDDHTITITGTFPNIYVANGPEKLKIKKVTSLGTVGWTTLEKAFWGCSNLTEFTAGPTDTSAVTDMSYMLADCRLVTNVDVSSFDTSLVTNMFVMFYECRALTSIDVSSFNTANAANIAYMFYDCTGLTTLDVSNFVTTSVSDMSYMFYNCTGLTSMAGVEDWVITGLNGTNDLTSFLTVGKMTTAQYDALLVKWEAQASGIPAMTASFGASILTAGGTADTAKQNLINTHGWTVYDGVTP